MSVTGFNRARRVKSEPKKTVKGEQKPKTAPKKTESSQADWVDPEAPKPAPKRVRKSGGDL